MRPHLQALPAPDAALALLGAAPGDHVPAAQLPPVALPCVFVVAAAAAAALG